MRAGTSDTLDTSASAHDRSRRFDFEWQPLLVSQSVSSHRKFLERMCRQWRLMKSQEDQSCARERYVIRMHRQNNAMHANKKMLLAQV